MGKASRLGWALEEKSQREAGGALWRHYVVGDVHARPRRHRGAVVFH
ncbi:MAG: hypothetical protein N2Z21_04790 [Candidatus Sumerlaeaceae bacterium]|nr:hypothetical protein [Candidatus Sumerlaeaceae bacterium]